MVTLWNCNVLKELCPFDLTGALMVILMPQAKTTLTLVKPSRASPLSKTIPMTGRLMADRLMRQLGWRVCLSARSSYRERAWLCGDISLVSKDHWVTTCCRPTVSVSPHGLPYYKMAPSARGFRFWHRPARWFASPKSDLDDFWAGACGSVVWQLPASGTLNCVRLPEKKKNGCQMVLLFWIWQDRAWVLRGEVANLDYFIYFRSSEVLVLFRSKPSQCNNDLAVNRRFAVALSWLVGAVINDEWEAGRTTATPTALRGRGFGDEGQNRPLLEGHLLPFSPPLHSSPRPPQSLRHWANRRCLTECKANISSFVEDACSDNIYIAFRHLS